MTRTELIDLPDDILAKVLRNFSGNDIETIVAVRCCSKRFGMLVGEVLFPPGWRAENLCCPALSAQKFSRMFREVDPIISGILVRQGSTCNTGCIGNLDGQDNQWAAEGNHIDIDAAKRSKHLHRAWDLG